MTLALRAATGSGDGGEHHLVALVRRGDDRGFEELYARYRSRIGAYVLGMVCDHGRAEDITQEVFISALRRMRETERPIAFKPWIYEIAKNACIDNARRTRRVQEVSLNAEPDGQPEAEASLREPTLESAVEARQQLSDLRGAFGCLSENHHRILVMRELEGRSYEQIGDRLGLSRGMVESALFRARRKLGEEYEELVSGRRCEFVQALVVERDARSLGIRERRRVARHLSHCQPCRREAHLAGFDPADLRPASIAERIAGLLPFPILPLRGLWPGGARPRRAASWLHSRPAFRSVEAITRVAEPASGSIDLGRAAAAAVAALALTGAGGGLIATAHGDPKPARPPISDPAASAAGPASTPAAGHRSLRMAHGRGTLQTAVKSAGSNRTPATGRAVGGGAAGGAQPPSAPGSVPTAGTGGNPAPGPAGAAHRGVHPTSPLSNVLPAPPRLAPPRVSPPKVSPPNVSLPKVTLPKVTLPPVSVPTVTAPKVPVPPVTVPKVTVAKLAAPRFGALTASVPPTAVSNVVAPVAVPKVVAPQVSLPPVAVSNVVAPQVSLPPVAVSNVVAPQVGVPRVAVSNVVVAPEVSLPPVAVSNVVAPQVGVPPVAAPEVSLPPVAVPDVVAPQVGVPPVAVLNVVAPQVSVPPVAVPNVVAPQVSAPPTTARTVSVPTAGLSPATAPKQSVPAADVPAVSAPKVVVPMASVPAADVPAVSAPKVVVPMASVPAADVPPVSAPKVSVPTASVPAADVPPVSAPKVSAAPATAPAATGILKP